MSGWEGKSGIDQEKAKKAQEGLRKAAADNPIANVYKYLVGEKEKPKT